MPIYTAHCSSCGRAVRVPDHLLGKRVRCPECGAEIQIDTGTVEPGVPGEAGGAQVPDPGPAASERPGPDPGSPERRPPVSPLPPEDDEFADYADDDYDDDPDWRRRRFRSRARAAVQAPAITLMVLGGIAVGVSILSLLANLLLGAIMAQARPPQAGPDSAEAIGRAIGGFLGAIAGICWGGIVLYGAWQMKTLRSYGYAMTASIAAMLPCNLCCLVGLPVGIWSLVVLNRPEVKNAFPYQR